MPKLTDSQTTALQDMCLGLTIIGYYSQKVEIDLGFNDGVLSVNTYPCLLPDGFDCDFEDVIPLSMRDTYILISSNWAFMLNNPADSKEGGEWYYVHRA